MFLNALVQKQVRYCTRSVHESNVFSSLGLAFERKQIPRIVANIGSQERGRSYYKGLPCFASRGSPVRSRPRPPTSSLIAKHLGVATFWQRENREKSGDFGRCRRGDGRKLPGYRGEGGISPGLALPFLVFSAGSRWRWAFCETPCIC